MAKSKKKNFGEIVIRVGDGEDVIIAAGTSDVWEDLQKMESIALYFKPTKSFLLWRKLSIGPKNAQRDISVVFVSKEPEENNELLHLLNTQTKP